MLSPPRRGMLAALENSERICRPCLQRLVRREARRQPLAALSTVAQRTAIGNTDLFKRQAFFTDKLVLGGQARLSTDVGEASFFSASSPRHFRALSRARDSFETARASLDGQESQSTRQHIEPTAKRRRQSSDSEEPHHELPLDASTQLSNMSTQLPQHDLRKQFFTYLALSKPRLTFLIVLTTTSAYTLFPVAASPMFATLHLSPLTLLNLTTGTALASASANALNMLFEPEHDAKMSRTRARPLVRKLITPRAALAFAASTGLGGVALLGAGVNPTVAFLGALNIFVYAFMYTPMKRFTTWNTWAGAIVGAIPPLMGWAAAAGQATGSGDATWRDLLLDPVTSPGGWLCAALLFAWQFPHFNALSYTIRHEYAAAGYKMLASINPRKNGLVALRYSLAMIPICVGLSYVGVTTWAFVPLSSVANVWMIREAWRFYKHEGAKGSARGLFWASIWQLPIVLVLAMVTKQGLWERIFRGGLDDEDWAYATRETEDENALEVDSVAGGGGEKEP